MNAPAIVGEPVLIGPDGRPAKRWELYEQQAAALLSTIRFGTYPAGRRAGKSELGVKRVTLAARRARAMGRAGTIWIVYPTYGVARVAWRKLLRIAPRGWITETRGTDLHPQAIRFGDVVVEFRSAARPELLVAEGLLFLWADECGIIPERVWRESLRPTLIDHRAHALFTGTPKGVGSWYHALHQRGLDPRDGEVTTVSANGIDGLPSHVNPFVSREEIELVGAEMSARTYSQEILGQFLSDAGAVFRLAAVRDKGLRLSTEPTAVIGIDLARSVDFTALVGMDANCAVTYCERFQHVDWPMQKRRFVVAWERLGKPTIVMDSTGVGDPVYQDLREAGLPIEPYEFTHRTRSWLLENLAIGFDEAILTLPDEPALLNELTSFGITRTPTGLPKYAVPDGKHDDYVMALALAYYGARKWGGGDLGITIGRLQ